MPTTATRFYEAFEALHLKKKPFCEKMDVQRTYFYQMKREGRVKVEWLTYLVENYGISAEWLLTGRGSMIKCKINPCK